MLIVALLCALAGATEPAPAELVPTPLPPPPLVDVDVPVRTITFEMDQLQRLSARGPFRVGLRLAPGVIQDRQGPRFISGAPVTTGMLRVDGIDLLVR